MPRYSHLAPANGHIAAFCCSTMAAADILQPAKPIPKLSPSLVPLVTPSP